MDVSTNIIDLEYLTNPCYTVKIPEKKKDQIYCVNSEDLNFYKKRIFELTRKMLLGGKVNTKINDAFHGWAKVCIEHFKFMDKKDIIQEDYKDIPPRKNSKASYFNMEETNKLFSKQQTYNDIATLLNIRKKTKPIFMPTKRNINLKADFLKNKGIIYSPPAKNNLTNKYEKTNKKKKKKEKKKKEEKDEKTKRRRKRKNCVKVEL